MAGAVATVSVGLAWLGLMAAAASATQFRVGGGRGWSVPDANAEPYNSWAGRMRFQIGDQLRKSPRRRRDDRRRGFRRPCKRGDDLTVSFFFFFGWCSVRVPEGDGRGGGGGSGGVRRVQHVVVGGRRRRRKVRRRQHGVHVRQVGALLLHQRQRGQLPRRREARRRRHGRPRRPPRASAVAAGCASSRRAGADAEPGVVATVACASRRHPELGAVSGSYDAEPIAVGFTYGAGACSDEVNTELATGASGHGTVAVNYPWRRGPAAAAAGDRWGERDDAGGARSQRPEWRRRRCSGGGRRRRHVAGSIHRLRHASYLKLSASAVTCSFICAV